MLKRKMKDYHYVLTIHGKNKIPGGPDRQTTLAGVKTWSGDMFSLYQELFDRAVREAGTDPKETFVDCWTVMEN